ncbi:MAG TPA: ABC transporter ATP-binding protein [Negativicutes bacterium]|nr:ABC transporter ATP-binding protein [Negativicutes bacterium]
MLLSLEHVSKNFGGLAALSEVSFGVGPGEIVGVIGPNGAGKTTLFNLITGVFSPTAGQISFREQPIVGLRPHKVTELGISRTFQNIRLFGHMTALENIMVGSHCRTHAGLWQGLWRTRGQRAEELLIRKKSEELLELVGIADERDTPAGSLPYGKQRRLEIARAMGADPELLLLDEPTAGMNESETEDLRLLIKKIQAMQKAVVLIEHDMHLVMNVCERLVILNFGRKIAEGLPEEIRENKDVIEAYLGREEE